MQKSDASAEQLFQAGIRHHQAGELDQAERLYREILATHPDMPRVLHLLGVIHLQSGRAGEAEELVNRALRAEPRNPDFLNSLGQIRRTRGDPAAAMEAFDAALAVNPSLAAVHSNRAQLLLAAGRVQEAVLALGEALRHKGDYFPAIQLFGPALRVLRTELEARGQVPPALPAGVQPSTAGDRFQRWPQAAFFYCPRYRFVYASVPKAACSSIKGLIYGIARAEMPQIPAFEARDFPGRTFHIFMDRTFTLMNYATSEAEAILASPEVFKFAFVRNPLDRLVSGYLNKFVSEQQNPEQWEHTLPVLRAIHGADADPARDGITFRQFVEHVTAQPDEQLDKHWRPMRCFFDPAAMDFVGRLENIDADFETVRRKLSLPDTLSQSNRSAGRRLPAGSHAFADMTPEQLRALDGLPAAEQLYDAGLKAKARERYADDCRAFGYA